LQVDAAGDIHIRKVPATVALQGLQVGQAGDVQIRNVCAFDVKGHQTGQPSDPGRVRDWRKARINLRDAFEVNVINPIAWLVPIHNRIRYDASQIRVGAIKRSQCSNLSNLEEPQRKAVGQCRTVGWQDSPDLLKLPRLQAGALGNDVSVRSGTPAKVDRVGVDGKVGDGQLPRISAASHDQQEEWARQ
jgi:hypothetical protein